MLNDHRILVGGCLQLLQEMPEKSVHCVVTSPPYYGLRDYGVNGQIGLEETPAEFIANLVAVFEEVRRVLRDDGTAWINMGDSYARSPKKGGSGPGGKNEARWTYGEAQAAKSMPCLADKQLMGMPWRLAFALQDSGWYLRQDIIWNKPNPMPESVRDRCTKSHEYIFLLSKKRNYYFDQQAIHEPLTQSSVDRLAQAGWDDQQGSDRVPGKTNGSMKAVGGLRSKRNSFSRETKATAGEHGQTAQHRPDRDDIDYDESRNKRSVWTVATARFKGAHFATFPPDLIRPCILAGSPRGGIVLDPFGGAGTTGLVAMQEGRKSILCELNPAYAEIANQRLKVALMDGCSQMDILIDQGQQESTQ